MPIERLQFENGYPIGQNFDAQSKTMAMSVVRNNREQVHTLSVGEYDLTPSWWINPTCSYEFIVYEDEAGKYITTTRSPGSGIILARREIRLPQDASWIMVLGPHKEGRSLTAIYDIIFDSSVMSPES
jgi:hypothetical protein